MASKVDLSFLSMSTRPKQITEVPKPVETSSTDVRDFNWFLDHIKEMTPEEYKLKVRASRSRGTVTYAEFIMLQYRFQHAQMEKITVPIIPKPEVSATAEATSRQQRTMTHGKVTMAVSRPPELVQYEKAQAATAKEYLERRSIDPNDLKKSLTTQLASPVIPYCITGLTAYQMISGQENGVLCTRPTGPAMAANMLQGTDALFIDQVKQTVTFNKFRVDYATLSYVEKAIRPDIGRGFKVYQQESRIEETGDSYFSQSKRNRIIVENTTVQTMTFAECDILMRKLASTINHNFDDLIRMRKTHTPNYVKVQSLFNASNVLKQSQMAHLKQKVEKMFPLVETSNSIMEAEFTFDMIASIRRYLMETKNVASVGTNASLRQKFKPIVQPTCSCARKKIIVYGSGPIVSALVKQTMSRHPRADIEFVDPAIDTVLTLERNGCEVRFSNHTFDTYNPRFDKYCLVISDIGSFEPTRAHFTNDYRYTNYYAQLVYNKFNASSCFMCLKTGFALGMPRVKVDSIWHFKAHNPEVWYNISMGCSQDVITLLPSMYLTKMDFNNSRINDWQKNRLTIGESSLFPVYDSFKECSTTMPFTVTNGFHIPYSNSIARDRLVPYARPSLGFLQPQFNDKQCQVLGDIVSAERGEAEKKVVESTDLTPIEKFQVVGFLMGKRIGLIGSRWKRSLGEERSGITEDKITTTTEVNARYLNVQPSFRDKTKQTISTYTPKFQEICVDTDRLMLEFNARAVLGDVEDFVF